MVIFLNDYFVVLCIVVLLVVLALTGNAQGLWKPSVSNPEPLKPRLVRGKAVMLEKARTDFPPAQI